MNSTIALPEIARLTGQLAGVDAEQASRYIVALFGAVESALAAGESASIKGIGTFRPTGGVPAVEFEPDTELSAAVNAPFALFSAVELPADAPDDIFGDETHEAETAPTEPTLPDEEKEPQPTPEPQAEDEELAVEETAKEATAEETTAKEATAKEATAEKTTAVETSVEEPSAEESEEEEAEPQPEEEPEDKEVVYVVRHSAWPWIAAILCLLAGFAGGYCYGTHCGAPEATQVNEPAIAVADEAEKTVETADSTEAKTDSVDCINDSDTTSVVAKEQPAEKEPVYDTVTSTRFLTTIARSHYGRKDFWVFIYEANSDKLRHPNRIRPGTRVVVPDLGEHAAADPELRARAHRLANEIYSRYDM